VPPLPKLVSSAGFEAFRYATCFNGPGDEGAEEAGDCELADAAAPQITATATAAERMLPLMLSPAQEC